MWIAFNRVSRWPLLFSRKNHHNETASLPVSVPSLSPREKISRRGGTLRNELSLLPFLTRELFRLFWMDRWIGRGRDSASMPSILGNGEALEERVNCDELGWGGERERGVSSSVYLSARFLIIFIEISLTDSWKSPEIYAFFLSQINSGVEISPFKRAFASIFYFPSIEFLPILGNENFGMGHGSREIYIQFPGILLF